MAETINKKKMEAVNRKEREKLRHREEILDAAEGVFAEKGFHRSTMEDVAGRAEFSVGTIYNYFNSKELLYHALIEQRFCQLRDEILEAMGADREPVAIIKAYIKAKVRLSKKFFDFAKLYTRERLGDRFTDNDLLWKMVAGYYDEVMAKLTQVFEQGIDGGDFRGGLEARDMTIALEGLTDGFMYEWLMFPDKYIFEDKLEVMIEMFFDGISQK